MGRRGSQRDRRQTRPTGSTGSSPRPPVEDMTPEEMCTWLLSMHEQLQRKQLRERAYLDHRARRGTYTPTDEAYQLDQILETDLLMLLDHLLAGIARHKGNAP